MNRAWTLTGYRPNPWPCGSGGGGGSDADAVHKSDFASVTALGDAPLDDTNSKVDEIIGKLKGTVACLAAALSLCATADLGPNTTFGQVSPTKTLSEVVSAGLPDKTLVLTNNAVQTKDGNPVKDATVSREIVPSTDGFFYSNSVSVTSKSTEYAYQDMPAVIVASKTMSESDPDYTYDLTTMYGTYQIVLVVRSSGQPVTRYQYYFPFGQSGTIALQSYSALSAMLDDAYTNSPPSNVLSAKLGDAPVTPRALIGEKLARLVEEPVSNVVCRTKDLHYDKTLGVTWKEIVDDGYVHLVAVTNVDVSTEGEQ